MFCDIIWFFKANNDAVNVIRTGLSYVEQQKSYVIGWKKSTA